MDLFNNIAKSGISLDIISLSSDSKLLSNNRARYSFFRYFNFENAASHISASKKKKSFSRQIFFVALNYFLT